MNLAKRVADLEIENSILRREIGQLVRRLRPPVQFSPQLGLRPREHRLLEILFARPDQWVSFETIELLAFGATDRALCAVRKSIHVSIHKLRQCGLDIESMTGAGYRLGKVEWQRLETGLVCRSKGGTPDGRSNVPGGCEDHLSAVTKPSARTDIIPVRI